MSSFSKHLIVRDADQAAYLDSFFRTLKRRAEAGRPAKKALERNLGKVRFGHSRARKNFSFSKYEGYPSHSIRPQF